MKNRRDFIKTSMAGTTGIAIGAMGFSAKSYAAVKGANERINVAVLGIRNQGTVHLKNLCGLKDSHNVQVKTVCDADERLFDAAVKLVSEQTEVKPGTEWDLRKVFEDKEIDAVTIAMPNHWHALAAVWACQAGKHVYVEKPTSHNIWEGRKIIEAARKYGRIVGAGLQNRSFNNVQEAIRFLHEGGIGEVFMARALCYKGRDSYGMSKDSQPPSGLHYDLWLGPAPWRPYNEKRGHYNWHWYWDTGSGDTGNTGPHQLDIARWGLNKHEHPVSVYSTGGIYGLRKDDNPTPTPGKRVYGGVETYGHDRTSQETPNTQASVFKYADGTMLEFETRGRYTNHEGSTGHEVGNLFFGVEGWLEIDGNSWKAFKGRSREPFAGSKEGTGDNTRQHWINYFDAIRAGSNATLNCEINEGHLSSCLPHLANISYRTGRALKFLSEQEKFAADAEADALLTRKYRIPYVVPEKV